VSWRAGLREVGPEHFAAKLAERDFAWVHIECRLAPDTLEMVRRARKTSGVSYILSVELEKTYLPQHEVCLLAAEADIIFFSKDWVVKNAMPADAGAPEACDDSVIVAALQTAAAKFRSTAAARTRLLICGWGSKGAFALDATTGKHYFEAAARVDSVVDSVGAGDTFIATSIFALAKGCDIQAVLKCACAVAGGKVAQVGFSGLARHVPPDVLASSQHEQSEPPCKVQRVEKVDR